MAKSIIKELIIVLLLLLAIILVLGIFLYDYIPTAKVVPKIEQYQRTNNIEKELSSQEKEEEEFYGSGMVYEIDGTDLKNYEKAKDYQKGKVNPFSEDATKDTSNNDNTNNNNSNKTNNSTTNKNTNSVGNYLPNTGTK